MPLEQLIADLTAALNENTKVQREALEAYLADRSPAAPKPRTRKAAATAEAPPVTEPEPTPVVAEPAQEPEPEATPVAEEEPEPEPLVVAYDDDKATDADLEVLRAINKDRQMKAGEAGKLGTYKERLLEVLKKHGITKFPDLKTKASVAAFKADLEAIVI